VELAFERTQGTARSATNQLANGESHLKIASKRLRHLRSGKAAQDNCDQQVAGTRKSQTGETAGGEIETEDQGSLGAQGSDVGTIKAPVACISGCSWMPFRNSLP
jgi:hypothetical protein